jgi:RNA polymerase sigma factor (sigma-70 family)
MTEREAIDRIRAQDRAALEWVYEQQRTKFVHWFMGHRKLKAEDALPLYHDVFLDFEKNVRSGAFQYKGFALSSYLIEVGKNKLYEMGRAETRRQKTLEQIVEQLAHEQRATPAVVKENMWQRLERALQDIGEPCKTLLTLFYLEEKSYAEIVQLMPNYNSADAAKNQRRRCVLRMMELVSLTDDNPYDLI